MATTAQEWKDLSPEEKRERRYAAWAATDHIEFVSDEAKEAYIGRQKRLATAYSLGQADRVPVMTNVGFFPVVWAGMTPYDAMYNHEKAVQAWIDFYKHFQPDAMISPIFMVLPGKAFETLEYRLYHWPGHGTPKDASYQFNEGEYMLAEEYDHLIGDASDFFWRVYLPRISGAFEGFAHLSHPFDYVGMPFATLSMGPWASPDVAESFRKLQAAGQETGAWASKIMPSMGQLLGEGFPPYWGGAAVAPFDFIGDSLRGTRGILLDLHREPEKLELACDRLADAILRWSVGHTDVNTPPCIFIPLHKGAEGFMSQEQFDRFYWPSLKKVILGLIDEGFTPFLFAEGRYTARLEAISDLPKGKTVWLFDQTDMKRAKETIGQVACIQGNVPLSLIHAGTPEKVSEYVRKLIDDCAEGGGYVVDIGAVADSGKQENIEAMVRTVKEYGVY